MALHLHESAQHFASRPLLVDCSCRHSDTNETRGSSRLLVFLQGPSSAYRPVQLLSLAPPQFQELECPVLPAIG
jgi:hypothetical protein